MKKRYLLTLAAALASSAATASPLVYHGNNPDISPSANPYNEGSITAQANQTRPHAATAGIQQLTEAELLKQSVISGLSATYQQLLTGNSSSSGTVNFGDGSYATYTTGVVNGVNTRTIVFHNLDGTTTTISFPLS